MARDKQFEVKNHNDLLSEVAERTGKTKKETHEIYKALEDTLTEFLQSGHSVRLPRLFTLRLVQRGPRIARSPLNGEKVEVPEKVVVKMERLKNLQDVTETVKPQ